VRPSELAPLHATPSCDLEAGATPTRTALTSASGATHLSLKAADLGSQL
jgi:hypothetical protein